ncbi:MAG: carboxymuconolactone decarboxylase family protein [Rhodohalobacter sp.]|uniref:carboxymuconolactone decarboxylase family protein n=1 Tax=Rhodohalobacter sp. TaxID=1974210 RepID=UPI00397661F8
MRPLNVPTKNEVTDQNRQIFDKLESNLGFVPNIYATYAHSKNGLARYMNFANGKTSLNNKEKEVINLAVSEINGCSYCLAAHTQLGKMNGFTEEQTLELRQGKAPFDDKFDALAKLAGEIIENRGNISDETLQTFFDAGYSKESLIDVIINVGEKSITNFLHNITEIPVDFPEAPELKTATV